MCQQKIKRDKPASPSLQKGIALIEGMIAVVLFSIGVLALVGMQSAMTKNVTQAKLRSEASYLANQIIAQMWVDQGTDMDNLPNYAVNANTCASGTNVNCSSWVASVQRLLPGGTADVTVAGGNITVRVEWQVPGEQQGESFDIDATVSAAAPATP